jgi:polyribonucleotide nucleotidyltransferase
MDMSDMFQVFRKELDWAGRKLILETGKVARQADGAVMATYGGTTVLATVVFEKKPKPGLDFFPLTVNYQEKAFAAGKIPGGFFKREGRPSEKEVLTSRLIDRPIRPLFHESYRNETLVVITTLAHDLENDPDILAMVATSAALTISGVPFMGPIGGVRVGYLDGKFVINPTLEQIEKSDLDLVVAGTKEGVLMVESEAKELDETTMLSAVMEGHRSFQPVIDAIIQLAEHAAKEPLPLTDPPEAAKTVAERLKAEMRGKMVTAYAETQKLVRQTKVGEVKTEAKKLFEATRPRWPCSASSSATSRPTSCAAPFSTPASASTAATPRRCDLSWPRSACCHAPTAPRCSPAARPRRWSWPRSAPARTSRSSTRSRASTASTSCCTTTCLRTRSARCAAWARPAVARSATASLPGARCAR